MITNSLVCYVQVHAHQFGDAVSECSKVIKLDPSFGPAHYFLGEAYSGRHQYAEAVSEHQEALRLSGNVSMMSAAIAANYAASGRSEDARRILNELLARSKNTYVSPYALGKIYVALGDAEAAFVMLEKAFEERSFELLYLADDPFFELLHNDDRFKQMIVKRGFPSTVHVAQSP
jgi:tetratricopeptide (TPR) repeat protein